MAQGMGAAARPAAEGRQTAQRTEAGGVGAVPAAAGMTPYYEDAANGITIWCADCRDVLPALPKVDLVLTDPPYGIGAETAGGRGVGGWSKFEVCGWDRDRPSRDTFELIRAAAPVQVIWGGNYFTDYLPPTMRWLIWDKGQRGFSLADCEMAWTNQDKAARVITYSRAEALRDGKEHPTQKPIAVIRWCIEKAGVQGTILDPFMGSGTTLVAAKRLGRHAIGIEIEERYCEIAAERLERERMELFEPPRAASEGLFDNADATG
jgi:DNA modification methylase